MEDHPKFGDPAGGWVIEDADRYCRGTALLAGFLRERRSGKSHRPGNPLGLLTSIPELGEKAEEVHPERRLEGAGQPPGGAAQGGANPSTGLAPHLPASTPPDRGNGSSRILFVDDDLLVRQLSAVILADQGYQVDTANDGEAGWEFLLTNSFDLVITDNGMPKLSGLDLVRRMRAFRLTMPVILISGAVFPSEVEDYSSLQVAQLLPKPFTSTQLVRAVQDAIRLPQV